MFLNRIVLFLLFLCFTFTLYPTIINIPADYTTIQAGINASANADTVLVQPGTYVENINFNGKNITVASLVLTTGDRNYTDSTFIDGNAAGSVVTFSNGEDSNAVLSGFTITNGLNSNGGGISISDSSPSLEYLTISNNSANMIGGGGIFSSNTYFTLKHSVVVNNDATSAFFETIAGGVYCGSGNAVLENVTVVGNYSDTSGGVIGNITMTNSIIRNNAPDNASGITANYSDIEGGYTGTGNIDEDPLFINGFYLAASSPCIDAGDPLSSLDPDGTPADMGAYYFPQDHGPVWYVSITGSDLTGFGTVDLPFATIQKGIDSAAETDTVLVQPGTYLENINFNGKNIVLGSMFLTTQDTSFISTTIIDGNAAGSVVTFENGEDSTAVLTGFTVTNGLAQYGGGIFCGNSYPFLKNVIISNNEAWSGSGTSLGGGICSIGNGLGKIKLNNVSIEYNINSSGNSEGGGIYIYETDVMFNDVTVIGNIADYGGGLFYESCNENSFKNTIITENHANINGGGICTGVSLENLIIKDNDADYGGGVFCFQAVTLRDMVVCRNNADYGGGIYVATSSSIINSTIFDNDAPYGGGGGIYSIVEVTLLNSILWNNFQGEYDNTELNATYSNIRGGCFGTGNIDSDPLFVDPYNGDFSLQSVSPCIDAGDPDPQYDDPDGTIADMGAYYFHHQAPPITDFTADSLIGDSPFDVNFTDLTIHGSGVLNNWYWDFGDGANSDLQNPSHQYSPGIYTISLTVIADDDSTDTETKTDYITVYSNDPPSSPDDLDISISGDDANLSWTAVDTTLTGLPSNVGAYLVYYSEIPDQDSLFFFHGLTTGTSYTHPYVVKFSDHMFYRVSSYVGDLKTLKDWMDDHPVFRKSEFDAFIEEKKRSVK